MPFKAPRAATTHRHDYLNAYVTDLDKVIDMEAIRTANIGMGVDPLGGAVLCVLWGFVVPATDHMVSLLEAALPGCQWLTVDSFLLGLIESAVWGFYVAPVVVPLHNFFARRAA